MRVGLCGAHRVGKTTLIQQLVERTHLSAVKTSTTQVFKDNGLDPSKHYDFKTRLNIQFKILDALNRSYQTDNFITDRTPIDTLAYLLCDVNNSVPENCEEDIIRYYNLCNDSCKQFDLIILVQPGINVVYEEGKALNSISYMEHLNVVMLGLLKSLGIKHQVIPRDTVDLAKRTKLISEFIDDRK